MSPRSSEVTFVMSYAVPTMGMERVALTLASQLSKHMPVRLVVLQGALPNIPGVQVCGARRHVAVMKTGRMRLLTAAVLDRSDDIDGVVILVGIWTALPWLVRTRSSNCRVIVWEHSMLTEKLSQSVKFRLLARAAGHMYRKAGAVVTVSGPQGDDLRARYPALRVETICNLVNPESSTQRRFRSKSLPPKKLVALSALTAIKRVGVMVEALSKMHGDVSLTIAGDGPQRTALESLASRLGVRHRVNFLGYITEEEVHRLLEEADVLIHASRSETFGVVFLEAAAMHVPVVAASTLVSEWMIPRYAAGLLFDGTPDDLAHQILKLESLTLSQQAARARLARLTDLSDDFLVSKWQYLLQETMN